MILKKGLDVLGGLPPYPDPAVCNSLLAQFYRVGYCYLAWKCSPIAPHPDDIFWWLCGDTLLPILLFVDILSRKAWAYVLTKSKKEKRAEVSVIFLQGFKDEVAKRQLPVPLSGLESAAASAGIAPLYLCSMALLVLPFK